MSEKAAVEKILIVGPAWIGDMVMAQSLFITLKKRFPDSIIDVVAPAWSIPVLSRMHEVNSGITLAVAHNKLSLPTRFKTGVELRNNKYTRSIIIPRSFKSAIVPFVAKIPFRTGYRGEMRYGLLNDIRKLDKSILTQTVQRQVALGLPSNAELPPEVPYPSLEGSKQNQQTLISSLKLNVDKPVIGIIPGAEYGPAKQWPVSLFRQLANKLVDAGHHVWVFGSSKDKKLANVIAQDNKYIRNLCGETSLVDVVDLIDLCQSIITNDSGLMHIAAATGKQVVAIYGSSSPSYTPPLTNRAKILYKGLECSPCFKRKCPYGHTDCLNSISVEDVLEKIHSDE